MKSKSIHSTVGPDPTGANLIEKILSTDAVVILMAIVLVLVLISMSG